MQRNKTVAAAAEELESAGVAEEVQFQTLESSGSLCGFMQAAVAGLCSNTTFQRHPKQIAEMALAVAVECTAALTLHHGASGE